MTLMNFKYTIKNLVHFRPAGYIVSFVKNCGCEVKIGKSTQRTGNLECFGNSPKINVSEQLSSSSVNNNNNNQVLNSEKLNENFLDASQIFSITGLGLKKGDEVFFCITGPDEQTENYVKNKLCELLSQHF